LSLRPIYTPHPLTAATGVMLILIESAQTVLESINVKRKNSKSQATNSPQPSPIGEGHDIDKRHLFGYCSDSFFDIARNCAGFNLRIRKGDIR
jgi:hypothetical protein